MPKRLFKDAAAVLTEADGRKLAVDMLLELRAIGADVTSIEEQYHEQGRSQDSVVARYLETVRTHGNPNVEVGFVAVLTDFLAGALDGAVPDPELYESIC